MHRFQIVEREGSSIGIKRGDRVEIHKFASEKEAIGRLAIIEEAFSWIGTPFVDCACVKGRQGAVDCAMLLRECYVRTGRMQDFDPRPYPPRWHVHNDEEKFIDWLIKLGAKEIKKPRLADIVVWRFGRTYSHGAILVNSLEVVHSYSEAGMVMMNSLTDGRLGSTMSGKPRPVRYFDAWSR